MKRSEKLKDASRDEIFTALLDAENEIGNLEAQLGWKEQQKLNLIKNLKIKSLDYASKLESVKSSTELIEASDSIYKHITKEGV